MGSEWLGRHVQGTVAPSDFFKNDWATDERRNVHILRVVHLAEMLLNLRNVLEFAAVKSRLVEGIIEPTFAELEVGKLLVLNKIPFRFVKATGTKGASYDLEIKFGDVIACADTKCKLEVTDKSEDTIIGSLRTARGQLPDCKPGIVFVKVPQSWNADGRDDSNLNC